MDLSQPVEENYANPKTCFFMCSSSSLFQELSDSPLSTASALAFYLLSALFTDSFVIIFVITVVLAALDFWVVKNVSGRILVGLRWWNEINDQGESSLARINKKDSWLFWWTLYLNAAAWIIFAILSLLRFQADYLLVVGVCLSLGIANIIGFTKYRKDARKKIQAFASQTIASRVSSTIQSAFGVWSTSAYKYVPECLLVADHTIRPT
ncbi:Golgi apparatus membrane protein TVP23-like - like 1 [Theobroma cacao]|nr:Golgi apparatus membrane protein TVP23-like - like 1 [Theobroma cacao]